MPYLKIKTANNRNDNDWTIINDLNLDKLTVNELCIGDKTFEEKFNAQIESIKSEVNSEVDSKMGEVDSKIGEVNAALAALENGGTSFTVYQSDYSPSNNSPSIDAAKGKFAIQITSGGYSILWYSKPNSINNPNSYTWTRINAIWG